MKQKAERNQKQPPFVRPADVYMYETQNLRRESSFRNRPLELAEQGEESAFAKCCNRQKEREKCAHLAFQRGGMASISNSFAVSRVTKMRARFVCRPKVHAREFFKQLQNISVQKSQRIEIVHQNQVYFSAMSVEQGIFCV